MTRVVQGRDGKFHTVDDGPSIDLEKARRETRDVIQGNVPFHVDPFTPRKQDEVTPMVTCFCSYLGETCSVCEPGRGDA